MVILDVQILKAVQEQNALISASLKFVNKHNEMNRHHSRPVASLAHLHLLSTFAPSPFFMTAGPEILVTEHSRVCTKPVCYASCIKSRQ